MLSTSSETGSSLGSSPERCQCQQNTKPLSTDAERLTVESAKKHLELLEVCQSAPFRRDSISELVRITQVATDVENLERCWEHLWQRPCAQNNINFSREDQTAQTGCKKPDSWLDDTLRTVKLMRLPSALQSSPECVQKKSGG